MNKKILAIFISTGIANMAFADAASLSTHEQKASYALGADLANNFKQQGVQIDIPALTQGMQDTFSGNKLKLSQQQMKESVEVIKQKVMAKQAEERKKTGRDQCPKRPGFFSKKQK